MIEHISRKTQCKMLREALNAEIEKNGSDTKRAKQLQATIDSLCKEEEQHETEGAG